MYNPKRTLLSSAIAASIFAAPTVLANDAMDDSVVPDLEVIVVSGSKTEKPLKDVAGSISVISEEDIEKQMVTDMNQLFKYDPSIQISGSAGNAQNFIVRGMGGDRVLMIKDGMRMNEGYGANGLNDIVGRGFIETDTLKQVEVAKGAASSLYGSDALAGIVVFTTKDASDMLEDGETFAGKVKAGYTSNGKQKNIGTTLALETGAFEHLLSLSARKGNEEQNYDKTKPALDIESQSFLYKAKWNINAEQSLSFIADGWQQETKGDVAVGLLSYFRTLDGYKILEENTTSDKDNLSLHLRYQSEQQTPIYDRLNVSLYQNTTKQTDIEYGKLDINANFGYPIIEVRDMWKTGVYEQETTGFLSNASLALNDVHTIGYGVDIEKSRSLRTESKLYSVEGTPKPGYPQESDKFPETDVFRAGVFFNDEMSFMQGQLTVTPGVRFDHYKMETTNAKKEDGSEYKSFDETNTSFNLAAIYKLTDTVSVFAQYGQGFKVPPYDLAYLDHDNSIYGYKIVPSEDLSPEKSDTYELGLRGHVEDFFFETAVFYSKYDDFLQTALIGTETQKNPYTGQDSEVLIYQYQNIDSVTLKGIEFATRYHINDNVNVFFNAAYIDGKDDDTGDYLQSITPLTGVAGVSYENEQLTTNLVMNWAARMTNVNEGELELPGYGSIDLTANYAFNDDLKLNVGVYNLTDKKYNRAVDGLGHKTSEGLDSVTAAGRSFNASVSYRF